MEYKIRRASLEDLSQIEEILKENDQLKNPDIDGVLRMREVIRLMGDYFLVASESENVIGMIRGCYDGSRAILHQISVKKDYQHKGVGQELIKGLSEILRMNGANTLLVTSEPNVMGYYENLGFEKLNIGLMLHQDLSRFF